MNLTGYVETLQQQLAVAAAAGGDDARALAERLTASLDAATASAGCQRVQAAGLSVVVSSGSGARYVRRPLTACAGRRDYLHVRAIQSGSGVT